MDATCLDTMNASALRELALNAWRRAEMASRRAEAESRLAEAERQRASQLATEVQTLQRSHAELGAETEALKVEVGVLLKRITKLTRKLAAATDRDAQLELELELRHLRGQLAAANQERFGTRSERRDRPDDGESEDSSEAKSKTEGKKKKKKRGHGPTPQKKLPIVEVVHLLDEADCMCPKCGDDLRIMAGQFEETELVSMVQIKYILQLNKQQKYRCSTCGHIDTALGPLRLIRGGRYDISFVVQVAMDKYLSHLPLEQQVTRMGRRGLQVTSQTLWDQLLAMYLVLLPTYIALQAVVLAQPLLFADETPWRVMGLGGKRRSAKWWVWILTNAAGVYFHILPTRGSAAARELLGDYAGVLVADGYVVYASLEKALEKKGGAQLDLETGEAEVLPNYTLAGCWMHARRPFFQAEKNTPEVSHALDLIAKLYAIEARAREQAGGDPLALLEHRRRLRDTESRPVVEELKLWRDAQRPLPGTKYAKGVTYLNNQWVPLTRFLDNPLIPLDNGEAERKIRGPVRGRKHYGGSQSEAGTRVAGLLYSLLMSAEAAGVDPRAYLMAATERAIREPGAVLLPQDYARELSECESV